jgi:hypothetical protein
MGQTNDRGHLITRASRVGLFGQLLRWALVFAMVLVISWFGYSTAHQVVASHPAGSGSHDIE